MLWYLDAALWFAGATFLCYISYNWGWTDGVERGLFLATEDEDGRMD